MTIKGKKFWLWRAVDQNSVVLDEILQRRRDKNAAKRLLHRLMKRQERPPKRFITDKLRSYGAAKRQIAPDVEHRAHKGLNNRAENAALGRYELARTLLETSRQFGEERCKLSTGAFAALINQPVGCDATHPHRDQRNPSGQRKDRTAADAVAYGATASEHSAEAHHHRPHQ